ncbi:serine/threonine-protein kinase [Aporhodopirellula aestuarii]|uniref:Serine/threonine protein kinase n=1 Tax=Aporhodopirellula aestuarii TaxID=2950107 RepID=A0ABT0UBA8_9BACT|nr:serine/threonine-protein kinase [Aporhodopirellula aestuarii]MCM2374144.1 serine/threonine protein kinase [Aporhodopirellula aestuarii]
MSDVPIRDELEEICDRFETAYQTGQEPAIEAFLSQATTVDPQRLLTELLQIDLHWKQKAAILPDARHYLERFPDHLDTVDAAYREFAAKTLPPDSDRTRLSEKRSKDGVQGQSLIPESLRKTGRFEFNHQLGHGGFGVVWRAYDTQLRRTVALKIPHAKFFNGNIRERFTRESQAAARLCHDGIVSVYDICLIDGDLPVIVSQFIDGPSLAEVKKEQRVFSCIEAAAVCADLADALHHAHGKGIVHRDLKPGNILTDMEGKAYITDFGLAKDLENEVAVTSEGDVLGTAAYMAPEQAAGLGREADSRCDIYSLGVILYEMVTGERPFRGTVQMLLLQVMNDPPPPPQRLNAAVDLDLQTIILKCMEKQPEYRYQTAADLRDDLLRFVNYEPILARPPTPLERFVKWYPSHATEMLGTYFIITPMTWIFFIAGGAFDAQQTDGYQLSSAAFLPWAVAWIGVGCMILKKGFWFEVANIPLLIAFISLPLWIRDDMQAISLIGLISCFGLLLQIGAFWARRFRQRKTATGNFTSRLSSSETGSS